MKRVVLSAALMLLSFGAVASPKNTKKASEGYQFTESIVIPGTSVKNQARSGTCWCFSGLSFIENEIIKSGGEALDLSEMWIVRNYYYEKAMKAVRLHGHMNFRIGGALSDVTEMMKIYGIVPQEVYQGLNYGTETIDFREIDAVVQAYVNAVIETKAITTAWLNGLNGILDSYFGVRPEKFSYKGKEYTPESFAASLPINIEDYVSVTSFTHHPFYGQFVIEVPDNWMWIPSYNVPLKEMMTIIDESLKAGYSVAWATDVSEKSFSRAKGVAIVPLEEREDVLTGTDAARWNTMSAAEKAALSYAFDGPTTEKVITQEMRQLGYDNYETTDDHGMVIEGMATDQAGNPFYYVKNSWSDKSGYNGYYYFSRPFVEYKTISIFVNKKAIPSAIAKSMKL